MTIWARFNGFVGWRSQLAGSLCDLTNTFFMYQRVMYNLSYLSCVRWFSYAVLFVVCVLSEQVSKLLGLFTYSIPLSYFYSTYISSFIISKLFPSLAQPCLRVSKLCSSGKREFRLEASGRSEPAHTGPACADHHSKDLERVNVQIHYKIPQKDLAEIKKILQDPEGRAHNTERKTLRAAIAQQMTRDYGDLPQSCNTEASWNDVLRPPGN